MTNTILIALVSVIVVGCAAPVQTKQVVPFPAQDVNVEDKTKGRIYVMRPGSRAASWPLEVYVNNQLIGINGAHGYLCWEQEPGKIALTGQGDQPSTISFTVEAGRVYYFYQRIEPAPGKVLNSMKRVSDDKGMRMLENECKPQVIFK